MLSALNPNGTVMVEGEIWHAVLENGKAEAGEEVIIQRIEGLTLYVKKTDLKSDQVFRPSNT